MDTSAVALPPPEKPKEIGGAAEGVVDDWPKENGAGLGVTTDEVGGVLGLAPNVKGAGLGAAADAAGGVPGLVPNVKGTFSASFFSAGG